MDKFDGIVFINIFLKIPMDNHSLKYSAILIRDIHMNSSCHKKFKNYTRTGITFQGHHAQNQCQLSSIQTITKYICKKQEYFDIALPPHPFAEAINKSAHYIWNEHPNARFFHTWQKNIGIFVVVHKDASIICHV